jgi:hypothetical protein
MTLNKATIILLGLEREVWEGTPESEKSSYKGVALCFFGLNVLSLIATFFLGYLLGFGWVTAVLFGGIASFILMSIVRFSLIILRRSVFDYENERAKLDSKLITSTEKADTPSTSFIQSSLKALKTGIFSPFRSLRTYLKGSNSQNKIPGLAGFIRWSILSTVAMLIIFPLAAILHKSYVDRINDEQRTSYINGFLLDETARLNKSIGELKSEIEQIRQGIKTGRESLSSESQALNEARIKMLEEKIEEVKSQSERNIETVIQKLNGKYFLVYTLYAIRTKPGCYFSLVLVLGLILIPHWVLYRLKTNPNSYYSEKAVLKYRSIIDEEYQKTETEGYARLKMAFGYEPGDFKKNIHWKNTPYNTVPRVHFSKKVKLTKSEFLKS